MDKTVVELNTGKQIVAEGEKAEDFFLTLREDAAHGRPFTIFYNEKERYGTIVRVDEILTVHFVGEEKE